MFDPQTILWTGALLCAVVAAWAAIADRRRGRRTRLDQVGWVPWGGVLLTALLVGAVCAGVALKQ
jgi:hypothetical protein